MSLWFFIAALALLSAVALVYSSRSKPVPSRPDSGTSATEEHFRIQLAEIEADVKSGRLDEASANAARSELARELMHHRASQPVNQTDPNGKWMRFALPLASVSSVVLAVFIYLGLGSPDQPSAPMAMRVLDEQSPINFARAIDRVELQLADTPDDLDGWMVLAPAYMRAGRFDDAARAYKRILSLSPPTADSVTDLAQAMLMDAKGIANDEIVRLLEVAVDMDPQNARPRFFLASEATRKEEWDQAIEMWNELLDLANGDETWLPVARSGLSLAMARGETVESVSPDQPSVLNDPAQAQVIRSMVDGLASRLAAQGGSIEEWTRLVRSQLVLGEEQEARNSYEAAIAAYPDAAERTELDAIAKQVGFTGDS